MQLHEKNPLNSDWSRRATPSVLAPSLAPHELSDLDAEAPQASPEHRARLQRYVKLAVATSVLVCLAAVVRVGAAHLSAKPPSEAATAYVSSFRPAAAGTPAPDVDATAPATTPPLASAVVAKPGADKAVARRALESGKARDAVVAAERATATDPADADAWLLLGAAQGELGNAGAARAAYRACVKSAKRGPVRECGAMLR